VLSNQTTGLPAEIKLRSPDVRAIRGAIDIGWELDLHGAARAAAEAAELEALAADAGVETAQWLATTEIARQYLVWQGARVRLQHMSALVQTLQEIERLTRNRERGGLASRLDVTRAAGELQSFEAQLPPMQTLVAVTEASVKVLLGLSPGADFPGLSSSTPTALPQVPSLRPGQPIELLQRRPDLRVAQRQLFAEAARLRESHADQWPRLVLGAVLGQQDLRLNGLGLAPSPYTNVALAFTAPLFNAGRLRASVERQSARERTAMLQYERAVLGAFQDVENSLIALAQEGERGARLAGVLDSRRDGFRYAQSLHREGQIDRTQLLEAQRGLISAELAAADSHTQRALGTVQLVKALGGGWYAEPPAASTAQPQP
jgi:NodT family efflux transporter outer membrane factor (OMF) lipoprotein